MVGVVMAVVGSIASGGGSDCDGEGGEVGGVSGGSGGGEGSGVGGCRLPRGDLLGGLLGAAGRVVSSPLTPSTAVEMRGNGSSPLPGGQGWWCRCGGDGSGGGDGGGGGGGGGSCGG